MRLEQLGWNDHFAALMAGFENHEAGRVVRSGRGVYRVATENDERNCQAAPSLMEQPVVGDWVAVSRERVEAVLTRRTRFSRKQAGNVTTEQVLAANIDVALLICGLGGDYKPGRLERYLVLTRESGSRPVVVLNKADLAEDVEAVRKEAEAVASGWPVLTMSAESGAGVDRISRHVREGETAVLLGSSGVGKSTILNRLLGSEAQRTSPVRASDGRGRHTTTHRELIVVPEGWLLIDTPGLRELQLWASQDSLEESFEDIEALAGECRFRDCSHTREPGCAVRDAITPRRLANYHRLGQELSHLERKQRDKRAHKMYRTVKHR